MKWAEFVTGHHSVMHAQRSYTHGILGAHRDEYSVPRAGRVGSFVFNLRRSCRSRHDFWTLNESVISGVT